MSAPDAPASSGLSDERKRIADSITIYGEPKSLFRQALHILSHDDEGARLVAVLSKTLGYFSLAPAADMDGANGNVAQFHPDIVDGKAVYRSPAVTMLNTLGLGKAVEVLAHELRHLEQLTQDIITPLQQGRILSPVQSAEYNWFIEADAQAIATSVAYRLNQAGHPEAWDSLYYSPQSMGDIARSFDRALKSGATEAEAKLVAFNAWFENGFVSTYTEQATKGLRSSYLYEEMIATGGRISELVQEDLQKFGDYLANADTIKKYYLNIVKLEPEGWENIEKAKPVFEHLKGLTQAGAQALQSLKAPALAALDAVDIGVKPAAEVLEVGGKKLPVIGAAITAGFVIAEVTGEIKQGKFLKAGTAAVAGAAETAGNLAGFGVGDLAREGVREVVSKTLGEENAPAKSGLRSLGESALAYGSKFMSTLIGKPQEPAAKTELNPAVHRPKTPGMKM